jgi:hypothetical protein
MVVDHARRKAMRRYHEGTTIRQTMPEVRKAQAWVSNAIRDGRLARPGRCDECGRECKPDAAHIDYSRPQEIRWLCKPCHTAWDKAQPKRPF